MLELNLWLMLTVFITFFILLFIMNKILFKPLLNFMDKRYASIEQDMLELKEIEKSIEKVHLESNTLLKDSQIQTNKLISDLIKKSKTTSLNNIESKNKKLEERYITLMENFSADNIILKESLNSKLSIFKEDLKLKFSKI